VQESALTLPERDEKPRRQGITMMIDSGLPTNYFADVVSSFSDMIDVVKFGWGTSLVTRDLKYKIDAVRRAGLDFYFGGTLFEKFVSQNKFEEWRELCRKLDCRHVEVSNGTIDMSNREKADYVAALADEFTVFSEVGFKDSGRSEALSPAHWISYIREDLQAGARFVITEARESGRSGICRANGELRCGLIEEIIESDLDLRLVLFEAPTKELQTYFVRRLGSNVNLGNVAATDVVALETLRLGLRADTLLDWDRYGRVQKVA
jgi:phosphosulfolactate synthase